MPVTRTEDQKIHCTERWSTITPASTRPSPPPMPKVAEMRPIEVATRSRGNSSRMIPKASGKIAPPAPWMARPRMSTPIDPPIADTSEPSAKTPSTASSTFSLPYMSPRRPRSGVRDARREQKGGEQPRGGLRRGTDVVLDRRQRRDDHRLGERVGDGAQDEDAEGAVRVRAGDARGSGARSRVQVVDGRGERMQEPGSGLAAHSGTGGRRPPCAPARSAPAWRPRACGPRR